MISRLELICKEAEVDISSKKIISLEVLEKFSSEEILESSEFFTLLFLTEIESSS